MSLTPKQEKFCQCIVDGMSYKDSYKTAYNTKATDQTIYTEASKLMLREDIQARIKDLRKPIENSLNIKADITREKQIEFILDRIEICKSKQDETSIIKYTDMLNKITGIYKDNETIKDNENNIEKLDNDTLNKIIRIG